MRRGGTPWRTFLLVLSIGEPAVPLEFRGAVSPALRGRCAEAALTVPAGSRTATLAASFAAWPRRINRLWTICRIGDRGISRLSKRCRFPGGRVIRARAALRHPGGRDRG